MIREINYEVLLRQNKESFRICNGWTIGRNDGGDWQVFYRGIDATFRLAVATDSEQQNYRLFEKFVHAWRWWDSLSPEDARRIMEASE